jgi:uncharacterized protein
MKIGVISDTHIPGRYKEIPGKVLEAFSRVDMVLHAGDLVEASVIKSLEKVCKDVRAVRGNMDSEELRKSLPEKLIVKAGAYTLGMMHGFGPADNLTDILYASFLQDKVDAIIFGHSHAPCNERKHGILFFNPGSATDTVYSAYTSYGLLDINDTLDGIIVRL